MIRSPLWECLGIRPSVSHVGPESPTSGKSMWQGHYTTAHASSSRPASQKAPEGQSQAPSSRTPGRQWALRRATPGLVSDTCSWVTQVPCSTARTPCPCLSSARTTPRALALEAKLHTFSSLLLSGHSSARCPVPPLGLPPQPQPWVSSHMIHRKLLREHRQAYAPQFLPMVTSYDINTRKLTLV